MVLVINYLIFLALIIINISNSILSQDYNAKGKDLINQ